MSTLDKKILVTGGAGFIGSNLVDKLVADGYAVVVIDDLSSGKKYNLNPKAKLYKIDVRDKKIGDIFKKEKPEIVFHFAAQIDIKKSVKDPIGDANTNIIGSINILENCRGFGVKKIVFASSAAVYGKTEVFPTSESYAECPASPYGIGKLTTEKYLAYYYKNFSLNYVSLRFANVYGPRQDEKGEAGVVAIFCGKILSGKSPIIFGNGKQTRDFIYVKDVVESAIFAMKTDKSGIFNIGTGKETDINNVFEIIKRASGRECEKLYKADKEIGQQRSCLDCLKAERQLEWRVKYNFEDGLRETVAWFKKIIKR
ncbi:MAG: GDP-mannose 4,6-dehydratase [Candidatus Staskawiczbacteria bacterium]|nr:GDP-mannose 4,6-dehydratase [Candidatus Staskawiczbacteria bacterium]